MRMNKAQTKVLVDKKYHFYNILGYVLLGGIPFTWLAITQDLFRSNSATTVTSWGIIAFGIVLLTVWSKIKEVIKDYNTYFGNMGKRAKVPIFFGSLSIILFLTYISIQLVLGVTITIAVGGALAIIPFNLYDVEFEKAKRMNEQLKKENESEMLKELQAIKEK